jgi:hypothetical protein
VAVFNLDLFMDAVSKSDYMALEITLSFCSPVYTFAQKISKLINMYIQSNDMLVKVGVSLVSCFGANQGMPTSA